MPQTKLTNKGSFTGITLAQMRNYLKYEDVNATEDALITQMMNAAVERIEKYCNVLLRACTVTAIFDDFEVSDETAGGSVILPCVPLSSVTSVYLIDPYGTETAETTYYQKGSNVKEIICPNWIEGYGVKVIFQAGYGTYSTTSASYGFETDTFTSADLTDYILTIIHNKGTSIIRVKITNPSGTDLYIPYTAVDTNTATVDLGGYIEAGTFTYLLEYWTSATVDLTEHETESIPDVVIQTIYKLVGRMFENRDSTEPLSGEERKDLNLINYNSWI